MQLDLDLLKITILIKKYFLNTVKHKILETQFNHAQTQAHTSIQHRVQQSHKTI